MTRRLARLLAPTSVAVIGGGAWCSNVIAQCQKIGFGGSLWAVHPSRPEVCGIRAFSTVTDLPEAPDAAFVGINRAASVDVVGDLAARGAGGAVCFASGYAEAAGEAQDGPALQQALLDAAGDMPVLGPNCYGFINCLDRVALWPDQHGSIAVDRGVAIVTQSSNIAINLTMQRRGLPIGAIATAGNQAQTSLAEIGAAFLADPRITSLGIHIEGVADVRAMEKLAAAAGDKPIVALKIGRSPQARATSVSHTASLAGSAAGAGALLSRLGIPQVDDLESFLETLKLLHMVGRLRARSVASMSCSGGEASLVADLALEHDIGFPPLNRTQTAALRAALGPMVSLANPLDYHTYVWGDVAAMSDAFTAMMANGPELGLVIADFPRADRCCAADWESIVAAAISARDRTGKSLALVSTLPENMPEDVATDLIGRGIVPLVGLRPALAAVAAAATAPAANEAPILLPRAPARPTAIGEFAAKQRLARYGVRVPAGHRVHGWEATATAGLTFPIALKGEGPVHKTEAGAVALNLAGDRAVLQAARAMQAETFVVEEMVTDGVAELLVGVVLDPAHGYVLTLGAGGTLAELMADTASLLVPATQAEVTTALRGLRAWRLLSGYRGAAPADVNAIVQTVMAVQAFVEAHHGQLAELEINPLICRSDGAVAVDALIRMETMDD